MTSESSIITTEDFESTPPSVLKPIEQQQTPVNKSACTAINSSKANFEKEREAVVTSSEEVDTSQKYDKEAAPDNTTPESTEKNRLDEGGGDDDDDFEPEDDSELDSEDDFPKFEGGEPRGRVVNPYAGSNIKPTRPPTRPK